MGIIRRIRNIKNFLIVENIEDYLRDFSKNPRLDTSKYSIENYFLLFHGYHGGIFRDTHLGFDLVYSAANHLGRPSVEYSVIACVGFTIGLDGTVTVRQIQGSKDADGFLEPLKWERMLLEMVVKQASGAGFKQIRVQRAKDNKWWSRISEPTKERLKVRYDVTAERRRFRYDESSKYYVLELNGSFK